MDILYINEKEKATRLLEEARRSSTFWSFFIGSTLTSTIPGISIAGPDPEGTLLTPTLDVEYLELGKPRTMPIIPVTPEGLPTPAIITRAMMRRIQLPHLIINAGAHAEPLVPHVSLPSRIVANPVNSGKALPLSNVRGLLEESKQLARNISGAADVHALGESIPGGTTTALAILEGLGYDAYGKVSSASPNNPHELKIKLVREGLSKCSGTNIDEVLACIGDPVHIAMAGYLTGALESGRRVILAGGTQMTAVAAIAKALGAEFDGNVIIATTAWVAMDKSSDIASISRQIGIPVVAANMSFGDAPYPGLRKFDEGYVKEGVGAGGSIVITHLLTGLGMRDLAKLVYDEYLHLMSS
ncbi:MAG: nicotinate mononucleotide-dependent phosphoribosyltransferase CobT [Thermocladium sp.]